MANFPYRTNNSKKKKIHRRQYIYIYIPIIHHRLTVNKDEIVIKQKDTQNSETSRRSKKKNSRKS